MIIIPILLCIVVVICILKFNIISIPTKYKKYIIMAYFTIIIVSTLSLYFIPKNNLLPVSELDPNSSYLLDNPHFKDLIASKKAIPPNILYKKASYSFDSSKETLKVTDKSSAYDIICERKAVNDGKIEVIEYITPSYIGGVNVTDKVTTCSPKLNIDELTLFKEENVDLKMTKFELDLPTKQFSKTAVSHENTLVNAPPLSIIHIKFPKNCQITVPKYPQFQVIN